MVPELSTEILGKGEYAWFLLEQIEDDVMEIADNVSLCDDHLNVYSRRVALKIYEIGILAESIIKEIVNDNYLDGFVDSETLQKARKPKDKPFVTITSFEPLLRSVFDIEKRTVLFRLFTYEKSFTPFSTFGGESVSPEWWKAYQHIKHNFFDNIADASVKQLLEGAAAVFLLTVLCRSYWPALTINGILTFGYMTDAIHQPKGWELLYRTLYDAIPAKNGIRKWKKGLYVDILARSRLFSATLAKWDLDKYEYEIPL